MCDAIQVTGCIQPTKYIHFNMNFNKRRKKKTMKNWFVRKWMKRLSSLTFIWWHKMRQIFSLILWTSLFLYAVVAAAVNFAFNCWPFYESSRSLVSTEKYHCWIIHCFPFSNCFVYLARFIHLKLFVCSISLSFILSVCYGITNICCHVIWITLLPIYTDRIIVKYIVEKSRKKKKLPLHSSKRNN